MYSREAYALIYCPMAVIVALSALLILWASRILAEQERRRGAALQGSV